MTDEERNFILGITGALAWLPALLALIPVVIRYFQQSKIQGKIISRYNNLNKDKTQTFFLFKLSIFTQHKSFNIKNISCELEDLNGKKFSTNARNNRLTVFTWEMRQRKLLVPEDQFLNNCAFLPVDQNVVGYLMLHFKGDLDRPLKSTNFIFESFDGKIKRLELQESGVQEEQLLFDDNIWGNITKEELEKFSSV